MTGHPEVTGHPHVRGAGEQGRGCCAPGRPVAVTGPEPTPGPAPGQGSATAPLWPGTAALGTVALPVGNRPATFLMGTQDPVAHPADREGPVRPATVQPFRIAATAVTNAQFARFAEATGHLTTAERYGDSLVFAGVLPPGAGPAMAVAGAPWWRVVPGASWRHPEGLGTGVAHRQDHPVVHVSLLDALAYCRWVGGRLPTEVEWEYAARGGLEQCHYPWGDEFEPGGWPAMNVWRGRFPDQPHGGVGTVPVDAYAPNGYGLYNATGNVWEWTASAFGPGDPRPVLRGGSYLCHASYCARYRTSARIGNTEETSTGHSGFRVAY